MRLSVMWSPTRQGRRLPRSNGRNPGQTSPADAAQKVEQAAGSAPAASKTARVLEETARAIATPDPRQREVVSEAAQEVLNPEQQGAAPTVENPRQREFLRRAVLKRLKPLDAVDADFFIKVNHLPHTRFLNAVFYGLTLAFQGGAPWYIVMGLVAWRKRGSADTLFREAALPMAACQFYGGASHQALFQTPPPVHHDHSCHRHWQEAWFVFVPFRAFGRGLRRARGC